MGIKKIINCLALLSFTFLLLSCGKSEIEIQKERLQKEADALKKKIDSTQVKIDSAWKDYDSLERRIKKESHEIDSMMKLINPLKK